MGWQLCRVHPSYPPSWRGGEGSAIIINRTSCVAYQHSYTTQSWRTCVLYCWFFLSKNVIFLTLRRASTLSLHIHNVHFTLLHNYTYIYSRFAMEEGSIHRRSMELEDKAKVVASVWGAEFVQFLAALAVLPWSTWNKRSNSSYFSKSTEEKQIVRQGIEQILPPKQTRRPLPCLLSLPFFYAPRCQ